MYIYQTFTDYLKHCPRKTGVLMKSKLTLRILQQASNLIGTTKRIQQPLREFNKLILELILKSKKLPF